MKVIISKDYAEMSRIAANEIMDLVNTKPDCVLGLATGSTPIGMYKELVKLNKEGKVDFSRVKSVNLDEYIGLDSENPQSYKYFMNENLFKHININKENTFVPNGMSENIDEECRWYDRNIKELGGIDLQVLGIGHNGHIGFNEPSEFLQLGTHLTDLDEETIKANSRFFSSIEDVPTQAVTMGLGGIMRAKKIVLLASGEEKAAIIAKLAEGRISTSIPASILQVHSNVLVIIDEKAGAFLKKTCNELIEMV
jgi:glucosamine-6-phosphate deaminase